jgi:hypothetical protein
LQPPAEEQKGKNKFDEKVFDDYDNNNLLDTLRLSCVRSLIADSLPSKEGELVKKCSSIFKGWSVTINSVLKFEI